MVSNKSTTQRKAKKPDLKKREAQDATEDIAEEIASNYGNYDEAEYPYYNEPWNKCLTEPTHRSGLKYIVNVDRNNTLFVTTF